MSDQTPDLAALEALAEAIDGEWSCSHDEPSPHRPPDTYDVYLADGSAEVLANLPWELATYVAAADPQTVLWLIREVKRLREPLDDLEIVNGWLVRRGVHEPEYPAGVEYGPMPCSDAEPLVQLSTLSGWPDITRAERAEATIERARELADSWARSRSDLGPVTRACGALLRAVLDGGGPDA